MIKYSKIYRNMYKYTEIFTKSWNLIVSMKIAILYRIEFSTKNAFFLASDFANSLLLSLYFWRYILIRSSFKNERSMPPKPLIEAPLYASTPWFFEPLALHMANIDKFTAEESLNFNNIFKRAENVGVNVSDRRKRRRQLL